MKKKVLIWGIILAVLTAGIVLGIIYREPIGNWLHDVFVSKDVEEPKDDEMIDSTIMPNPDSSLKIIVGGVTFNG